MSTTTNEITRRDEERYVELAALEVLFTTPMGLGDVLQKHLEEVTLEEGMDLRPHDNRSGLVDSFEAVITDEIENSEKEIIIHAHVELLIARMLRSITPEEVERAATYFEALADTRLSDLLDGRMETADA